MASNSYLTWSDIAAMYKCGRSKARLIMDAIGVVYVGKVPYVRASDLDCLLEEKGEIKVKWPQRSSNRKKGAR